MSRSRFRIAALVLCLPLFGSLVLSAHDLPLNNTMNAFVKIEPHEAQLVIRIPLDLLSSVAFPLNGNLYDLGAIGAANQQTLDAISNGVGIWENGIRLTPSRSTARLSLPSDRSFEDYDRALAHVAQGTDLNTRIYYQQGYFDAHFVYPISSPKSAFTIQTWIASDLKDYAKLTIRYLPLDESSRAMIINSQLGQVSLNPSWFQAARGFVVLGVGHILSGTDHLLFLLCLIIPLRRLRSMIPVVSAFTVGHSITLLGSAYGLAPAGRWFPPFVEAAIAASIFYMALENIVKLDFQHRWMITGFFGLIHGFGFSYALKQDLQFSGKHLLVSLFSFNIGIEIGQLVVLAAMLIVLRLAMRGALAGRMGVILLSAIVAHTAWHWMIERGEVLWQTPWPTVDNAALITLARWVAVLLLAGGIVKWITGRLHQKVPALASTEIAELKSALRSAAPEHRSESSTVSQSVAKLTAP